MSYSTQEIREMIKEGDHSEIISAFKEWSNYRSERFSMEKFDTVEINGLDVVADGRSLSDDEICLWLDWCRGITYKDR